MANLLIVLGGLVVWMIAIKVLFVVAEWISPDRGENVAGYITIASFGIGLLILILNSDGGGLDPADTYRR